MESDNYWINIWPNSQGKKSIASLWNSEHGFFEETPLEDIQWE